MSTNIIFNVPGRTTNYMPVDVNTPKEDLLEKYARESFSTENTWPYESPSAGYYDIKNSDTKLILLNNQKTWSHLRGKTKAKREPFVKDEYYDWVERENEMKRMQEKNGLQSRRNRSSSKGTRTLDPDRHFNHPGCSFKLEPSNQYGSSSTSFNYKSNASTSRPRTTVSSFTTNSAKKEASKKKDAEENEHLLNYLIAMGKRETGLQAKVHHDQPPSEFLQSYNLNHPGLKRGQRLHLNDLCHVYSVYSLKQSKQTQYMNLLQKQKDLDKKARERFKMHSNGNFDTYRAFIETNRPVQHEVNCGFFNPRRVKTAAPSTELKKPYITVYQHKIDPATDFDKEDNNEHYKQRLIREEEQQKLYEQQLLENSFRKQSESEKNDKSSKSVSRSPSRANSRHSSKSPVKILTGERANSSDLNTTQNSKNSDNNKNRSDSAVGDSRSQKSHKTSSPSQRSLKSNSSSDLTESSESSESLSSASHVDSKHRLNRSSKSPKSAKSFKSENSEKSGNKSARSAWSEDKSSRHETGKSASTSRSTSTARSRSSNSSSSHESLSTESGRTTTNKSAKSTHRSTSSVSKKSTRPASTHSRATTAKSGKSKSNYTTEYSDTETDVTIDKTKEGLNDSTSSSSTSFSDQ